MDNTVLVVFVQVVNYTHTSCCGQANIAFTARKFSSCLNIDGVAHSAPGTNCTLCVKPCPWIEWCFVWTRQCKPHAIFKWLL